jgi:hypothetical protein
VPFDRRLKPTHTTEISPSVRGLQATHAAHRLGNPYIRHKPSDTLQLGFLQPDYSCGYCGEHFRKLLILDRTESFVADESQRTVCNSPVTAHVLFPLSFFEYDVNFIFQKQNVSRDNSVGIASGYALDGPGIEFR